MNGVTRHYADVEGRLVHYRRAGHGPPVVLLHESPRSSAALLPLIELLPDGVTVFALDTPGYGQSDPLPADHDSLADFADATVTSMRAIGIGRAPIYGTHTGASIAFAVALRHPEACAIAVLDGFPVFTPQEREEALANYLPLFRPAIDGTHLAWLWSRVRDQTLFFPWYRRGEGARLHLPSASTERLHAIALDLLRAGDGYRVAYARAFASRPLEDIAGLRAPVLFASRMDDVLLPHLERLPPGCDTERFPADRAAWAAALHAHFVRTATGTAPPPSQSGRIVYADLPGGQLLVRGHAAGSGKPLLRLHALPGSSAGWPDDAPGRTVVAPDLPGAGDSDALGGDPVELLQSLCDARGIDAADVEGRGTGAILAHLLAARDPHRFRVTGLADRPGAGAEPAPAGWFAPHPLGAHLIAAWHHARDAAILGEWETRVPPRFDTLNADATHARAVELLKARADPAPAIAHLLHQHRTIA